MKYSEYDYDSGDTPVFDKLIAEISGMKRTGEDEFLFQLLQREEVAPWFESSLPQYNEWCNALDYENAIEFIGPMFHKGFRQFDIVESAENEGCIDMKIWKLLDSTEVFWKALHKVCDEI